MHFCNFAASLYRLKRGHGLSFEQTWIPFTQGCLVPSLVERGPVGLETGFKGCHFNFTIISIWKGAWPFIWSNLYSLHPEMFSHRHLLYTWVIPPFVLVRRDDLCMKQLPVCLLPSLVEICPGGIRFWNVFSVYWLFRYYLPLEKGVALLLNKLEIPSPKDVLCQVWLTLAK